ncbi:MAG: ECF RNA polymerase sigma factor SigW [Phycisphaerae bacterium]|nr:ECF RNA polymerase sigma factor SigW [Phycisphaerae bacterium]
MARYQDRVFNLVYRLSGHYQDAQDITQDVFLRVLEHIGNFRQQAQFYTWLFRIAVNVAISRRRRGQRVRFHSLDATTDSPDGDGEMRTHQIADPRHERPDDAADRGEQVERVTEAIGLLDDEFRSVLVLKDIEGLDYQQIAEILDLPLGTVKSRLHRARSELKVRLEPIQ